MDTQLLAKLLLTYNAHVVKKEGCWGWKGSKNPAGYGKITVRLNGSPITVSAHRVAYQHYVGKTPENAILMHLCDTPACTNPAHLRAGTQLDNMRDKIIKGRGATTACISTAKLTEPQVLDIWRQRKTKSAKSLAKEFGVAYYTVIDILGQRTWKHVTTKATPMPLMNPDCSEYEAAVVCNT